MHTIERTAYGIALRIWGTPTPQTSAVLQAEYDRALGAIPKPWLTLVDLRESPPLDRIALNAIAISLGEVCKADRVVLIVANATQQMQFRRVARDAHRERSWEYMDGSRDALVETKAIAWLIGGLAASSFARRLRSR